MGDFGCGDGGWTTVMKINGNKVTIYPRKKFTVDTEEKVDGRKMAVKNEIVLFTKKMSIFL